MHYDLVFCNLVMFMCCLGCWSIKDRRAVSRTSRLAYVLSVVYGSAK